MWVARRTAESLLLAPPLPTSDREGGGGGGGGGGRAMRLRAHPCGSVDGVVARGVELLRQAAALPDLLWLDLPCTDHYTPEGPGGRGGSHVRHFTSLGQVDGACLLLNVGRG